MQRLAVLPPRRTPAHPNRVRRRATATPPPRRTVTTAMEAAATAARTVRATPVDPPTRLLPLRPLRHLRPTTLARVMVASTSAPDRQIALAASSSKDAPSADLTIAQSPVAWFVTRYGASSSQRPSIETKHRKEINPCSHGPHRYG